MVFKSFFVVLFFVVTIFAKWGEPPAGWDDFKFGVVDGNRSPFKAALSDAVSAGIQVDYSYIYITTLADIEGFLFAPWFNYATSRPGDVKPSITIYMLQQGQDSPDGSSALTSAADASYMKKYFEGVAQIADSCKGTNPIYVIEPDVWGYLLAQNQPSLSDKNLKKICHINDLGLSWLSEFDNTMDNLPAAIIKTLKTVDPGCYAGILMAHWGFPDDIAGATADGEMSGEYISKMLKEPYRGDFIGIEKNGTDAGCWGTGSSWYWSDSKNEAYLAWCKALGQKVDLPLFGWQISIGYTDQAGYDPLPNSSGRYEDTYFQYFFTHVDDFIKAGFIGFDASCNNQGQGTWPALKSGEGDNGWFYDNLKVFNKARPYDLNLSGSFVKSGKSLAQKGALNVLGITSGVIRVSAGIPLIGVKLYSPSGKLLRSVDVEDSKEISVPMNGLSKGIYYLSASLKDGGTVSRKVSF